MSPYLDSIFNAMLDRPPQEWIAGIVVALFLAMALAGLHAACRRWLKVQDETVLVVAPGVVVIFAGMLLAAADSQVKWRRPVGPGSPADSGPPGSRFRGLGPGPWGPGGGYSSRLSSAIFEAADTDHDGRLSTEEAAAGAARFIHEADATGKDSLDQEALASLVRERMRPPGWGGDPTSAAPPRPDQAPPTPSPPPPSSSSAGQEAPGSTPEPPR